MESLTLKYRPKQLTDLVGQPVAVQTLVNSFKKDRLHHAYLFVGQFGCGKTSAARILAAMDNCVKGPTLTPCGVCDLCKSIFKGKHEDIKEIDAASGAGKVEQIRDLRKNIEYSSIDGARIRYFIIDEAQRMTTAANDALLKIIEEPPPHIRFILCTTDVQKLEPTVNSRCQRHDFRKIFWTVIKDRLSYIAGAEGIKCQEEALGMCARLASGSMRDAIQNLEKLVGFVGEGNINLHHAEQLFAIPSDSMFYDLYDEIVNIVAQEKKGDAAVAFRIINTMLQNGASFDSIYRSINDHLGNMLVCLTCGDPNEFLISVPPESRQRLKAQLVKCKTKLHAVANCLESMYILKMNVDSNMDLENALRTWFVKSLFHFTG